MARLPAGWICCVTSVSIFIIFGQIRKSLLFHIYLYGIQFVGFRRLEKILVTTLGYIVVILIGVPLMSMQFKRNRRFQYRNMVIERHIQILCTITFQSVAIHLYQKRKHLQLFVSHNHIHRNTVDHIPLFILEHKLFGYLGKGFAIQQYHILTLQRTGSS